VIARDRVIGKARAKTFAALCGPYSLRSPMPNSMGFEPTLSQKARKDGDWPICVKGETPTSVRVCGTVDGQPFLSNFLIAPDEVKKAGLENETGLDL
jgi:hypothetical protein